MTVDLIDVVRDVVDSLELPTSGQTNFEVDLRDGLPEVEADAAQLRQIVRRLLDDAFDAVGDHVGTIFVTTRVGRYAEAALESGWPGNGLVGGTYVALEVWDSGGVRARGQADDHLTRRWGGAIRVDSEPERGTVVKLLLRAWDPSPISPSPVSSGDAEMKSGQAVLLVDDEKLVRDVARHMLEESGIPVLTAAGGHEALEVFRRERDRIGCVLLDLTMPQMDGDEAFRELRDIDPNVPIVLSSGYDEQDVVTRLSGDVLPGFIQKPYIASQLVQVLRETASAALGSPPAP